MILIGDEFMLPMVTTIRLRGEDEKSLYTIMLHSTYEKKKLLGPELPFCFGLASHLFILDQMVS